MTILTWPKALGIAKIEWTPPDEPAQVNRSPWTKARSVVVWAGRGRWQAAVTLTAKKGQDQSLELQAFLAELNGPVNPVRIPAVEKYQQQFAMDVQVDGAGQTGYSLKVKNGRPGTIIRRGHKLTLPTGQMVMVRTTILLDASGKGTLDIQGAIRAAMADGDSVEAAYPTCTMTQTASGAAGHAVDPGQLYSAKVLQFEEV